MEYLLMTVLMQQPNDYQVSFRLNQLIDLYGRPQVFKTGLIVSRIEDMQYPSQIEMHILNLYNTFGQDCFFENFELIFTKELKKVG